MKGLVAGKHPCSKCGEDTEVKDSRQSAYGTRRRRRCVSCGHRFTTYEVLGPDDITTDREAAIRLLRDAHEAIGNMLAKLEEQSNAR